MASETAHGASAPPVPKAALEPAQRFVPVMLPPPAAPSPVKPSTIEIELAGGRRVWVGADVDTAALVRIVAALETGR